VAPKKQNGGLGENVALTVQFWRQKPKQNGGLGENNALTVQFWRQKTNTKWWLWRKCYTDSPFLAPKTKNKNGGQCEIVQFWCKKVEML